MMRDMWAEEYIPNVPGVYGGKGRGATTADEMQPFVMP